MTVVGRGIYSGSPPSRPMPDVNSFINDRLTAPAGLPTRAPAYRYDEIGEIEQQLQIEIAGSAVDTIDWTSVDVTFDVEFVNATFQRYSNLIEPQMCPPGVIIDTPDPVVISAAVMSWAVDDRGIILGATVKWGAHTPGDSSGTAFTGRLHLTFQGFGNVPNEPADPDFTP